MASLGKSASCLVVALVALINATANSDDALRECSVLPLAVGTEWVYTVGPYEVVERVTEHVEMGEELCAHVETSLNGTVTASEHLTVREDGVYRVEFGGQTIEPAFCVLKWPAEDGDSWEIDSETDGQKLTGTFNVTMSEVTVPAGEYETVHVESENFVVTLLDGSTLPLSMALDFATGVGRVKQVANIGGQEVILELKELNLPEAQ